MTIAGAFAYDNVFLINGVDVNDNIFGTNNNLFIEDAIEETQVLTSGISAEYGRFSGGVVNVVTKRGGDIFSGSYRHNLSNASWTDETPFETRQRPDRFSNVYEGTFGGPILRARAWFFSAGRYEKSTDARTFPQTGIGFDLGVDNKRYELKGTATPRASHTVTVGFTDNSTTQSNRPGLAASSIEPRTLVTRQLPNTLFVANWNGVLGPKLFATAQVSQKKQGFRNTGGTSSNIIDSPFRTRGLNGIPANQHYNAPSFDSTDPEDRNNRQVAGSLSTLLSSGKGGTHDLKGGFEWFRSTNTGGNSQTSTGYAFYSDYVNTGGVPVFDASGPSDSDLRAGHVAALQLAADARREHRHQDHVALPARPVGGQPQPDASTPASATRASAAPPPATSSAPTPTRWCRGSPRPTTSRPTAGSCCRAPTPTTPASTARRSSPTTPTSPTRR